MARGPSGGILWLEDHQESSMVRKPSKSFLRPGKRQKVFFDQKTVKRFFYGQKAVKISSGDRKLSEGLLCVEDHQERHQKLVKRTSLARKPLSGFLWLEDRQKIFRGQKTIKGFAMCRRPSRQSRKTRQKVFYGQKTAKRSFIAGGPSKDLQCIENDQGFCYVQKILRSTSRAGRTSRGLLGLEDLQEVF